MNPFNISVLSLTKEKLATLRPTVSLNIFDSNSREFDENGLFSALTYGIPGEDRRDRQFSYVDLKTLIFHPFAIFIFKRLKTLYWGILSGRVYATWDTTLKDFTRSVPGEGNTGYAFFCQYWQQIEWTRTASRKRNLLIDTLLKYKDQWMTQYVLILPAGLRDIDTSVKGRISKDPINNEYLRLIATANSIQQLDLQADKSRDQTRLIMQDAFNNIYDSIMVLLKGKSGFIQRKWATRSVFYGTRNVITAMAPCNEDAGSPNAMGINSTVIGIYQHCKSIEPVTIHYVMTGFISKVFQPNHQALVTDPKTLKSVVIEVNSETYDQWNSSEGITKVINRLSAPETRHQPIIIGGHYIGLVYLGPGVFKFIHGIEELPLGYDRKLVKPITLVELIYISGYRFWNTYPTYVTRYPAITIGSIYPSYPHVRTTTVAEVRHELGDNWEPLGEDYVAYQYPRRDVATFIESMSPNITRLNLLGADNDGDMVSNNSVMTDESIAEAKSILSKTNAYLQPSGGFKTTLSIEPLEAVMHNFTSR